MFHIDVLNEFLRYNDWANDALLDAAHGLDDTRLDQPFEIGMGSLRRTLIHIWAGEHVWLQRWQRRAETPWPDELEPMPISQLKERFALHRAARTAFVGTLDAASSAEEIIYRDSKGGLFQASLSDMLMQGVIHSIHHRAQAANLVRRAGGGVVDLDYMYWKRRPM